jgi:hypothetical protein
MGETTRTVKTGNGSPDEIREEIARTQARVGETLEEIERRLSPRRLYERAREATERAVGDRGRQVVRQVDELGRGRVAGGAVGSLTAVWLLARSLRARRGDTNGKPSMTRVHSTVDPDAAREESATVSDSESSHPGPWTGALALLGAVGLMLAARYANSREEQRAAEADLQLPLDEEKESVQPVEHEHALPATQI